MLCLLSLMQDAPNTPVQPLPFAFDIETKAVLKQLNSANKRLAELKGLARTIPNEEILIQTLTLQEARESSSVENIVTTQDDLYRANLEFRDMACSPATKEVMRYREAIRKGFTAVRKDALLTNNMIMDIQGVLVDSRTGFRAMPGTVLKNQSGEVVYTPPQNPDDIVQLMKNLEAYINTPNMQDVDPLIKLAVIHHQFESIHPFYDGNGRTGRIICILYLVVNGLLDLPILYLSRYITRNKPEYYRLLQGIRDNADAAAWEQWVLYILKGIEETAMETIGLVNGISTLMAQYKDTMRRECPKIYSHDLLNCLFHAPYTKSEHLEREMSISRPTASKYLEKLAELGLLSKQKLGRNVYFINTRLYDLFANTPAAR